MPVELVDVADSTALDAIKFSRAYVDMVISCHDYIARNLESDQSLGEFNAGGTLLKITPGDERTFIKAMEGGWKYYSMGQFFDFSHPDRGKTFVAVDLPDERAVGTGTVVWKQHEMQDSAVLYFFYVDPPFQGKGIGTRILRRLFEAVGERKSQSEGLSVVADAILYAPTIRYYMKRGFEVTGEHSNNPYMNFPSVRMRRVLKADDFA